MLTVASIQTNHTYTSLDSIERFFSPIRFFPHWSHDSSFVGASVVGPLYSVQYKSIFGAPEKVRHDTCDKARPLSQVWGVEPNTSSGYEVAEPPHHHQIIAGMQDCIPMQVFGTGQTEHIRSNGYLHGPLFLDTRNCDELPESSRCTPVNLYF
jgi:hypothetical protein